MAFMVTLLTVQGCSSEGCGKGCCLPLPRGDSGFQLAQAIGQHPEGTVQAHIGINPLHRAGLLAASVGVAAMQSAFGQVFLGLCGRRAYVEHRRQTVVSTRAMLFFST